MAFVKNPIVSTLQTMIGLSPKPEPLIVDTGNASLTIPLIPEVARRSLAGIGSGWFTGLMENVHSSADAEASTIDPYNPGALRIPPYPEVVQPGFDIWVLGVSGRRSSGSGGLSGAVFTLFPSDESQGWGVDDQGAALVGTPTVTLGFFDGLEEVVQAFTADPMINSKTLQTWIPVGIRVPRGAQLGFETEAAAAAEFQGQFLLGLFPAGLGQDVAT